LLVRHHLLSEPAIISRLGKAVVGNRIKADWDGSEKNYDFIRDHISRVVGGKPLGTVLSMSGAMWSREYQHSLQAT
jgi:hypothetical protein